MSETVHGTAVLAGAHGVLIRGDSGAGKSALAAELIAGGARLVADDRVHISAVHGRIVAAAPAAVAGRIELRGRGLVPVPYERSAVIRLVVDFLGAEALERLPEDAQLICELLGVALPCQPVPAVPGRALILVEAALRALLPQCNMGLRSPQVWG
jgi:serine kinase of HPr protein (carbohydrate metabolism regulator)